MALICVLVRWLDKTVVTTILCTDSSSLGDILPGHIILIETKDTTRVAKIIDIACDKTEFINRGRRIDQPNRILRVYRKYQNSRNVSSLRTIPLFMDEEVRFKENRNDFHQHSIPTRSRSLQGESKLLQTGHSNASSEIPQRRPVLEQTSSSSLIENQAGNSVRGGFSIAIHQCREHQECRERSTGRSRLHNSPQPVQGDEFDGSSRGRPNVPFIQYPIYTQIRQRTNGRNGLLDTLDSHQNSLPSTSISSRRRPNKRNRSCPSRRERRQEPQRHNSLQNLQYQGQQVFIDEGSSDEDDVEVCNINGENNTNSRDQRNATYEQYRTHDERREQIISTNNCNTLKTIIIRPRLFIDEGSSDTDLQNEEENRTSGAQNLPNRQYPAHNPRREHIRGRRSIPDVRLRSAMLGDDSSSTPSSDMDVPINKRRHGQRSRSIPNRSHKLQRGQREQPIAPSSLPSAPERHQNRLHRTRRRQHNIINQQSLVHGKCRKQLHRRSNRQNISQRHQAYNDNPSNKNDNENISTRQNLVHSKRREQTYCCRTLPKFQPGPTVFIDEDSDIDVQSQPHGQSNIPNQQSRNNQEQSNTYSSQPSTSRGKPNRSGTAHADLKGKSYYHSRTQHFPQGQQMHVDKAASKEDNNENEFEGSSSDKTNTSSRTYTIHSEDREHTNEDVQNPTERPTCSVHSQSNDNSNPMDLCRGHPVFGEEDISDIEHESPFVHDLDLPNLLGPSYLDSGERQKLHHNQKRQSNLVSTSRNNAKIQPDKIVKELEDQNQFDNSRNEYMYPTPIDRQAHSMRNVPQTKPISENEDSSDVENLMPSKPDKETPPT